VNPLLILGALGVGAYVLLSPSTASAASAAQPMTPPGLVPRASPLALPQPPSTYDPSTDPGPTNPTGGVVTDPNLGGVPDMTSVLPSVQPWQSVVASGPMRFDPLSGRWY